MPNLPDWKSLTKAQRLDLMEPYRLDGKSSAEIAQHFQNCTRNSVIGALTRAKAPLLTNLAARRLALKVTRPRAAAKPKAIPSPRVSRSDPGHLPPDPMADAAMRYAFIWGLLPGAKGVRLVDHHEGQCRWGAGDPLSPDFMYCGEPVERPGGSWCAVHQRRATKTVEQSRAEAEEYKAAQRALV